MGMYTVDQVRHPYVVKKFVDELTPDAAPGTLAMTVVKDKQPYPPLAYFDYVTGTGEVVRTDLIKLQQIEYISAKDATERPLKKLEIEFDPDVNGGEPVEGEIYMLRITYFGLGMGGNEVSMSRTIGGYRASDKSTKKDVLEALLKSFEDNFKHEFRQRVKASIEGEKLVVEELPGAFKLGVSSGRGVDFTITPAIVYAGNYGAWAKVTDVTKDNTNKVPNGVMIADMEHFYMGERMGNWNQCQSPYNAVMLADPTKKYPTLDICYYYVGNNEDIQHSRKMLTFFFDPDAGVTPEDIGKKLDPDFPVPPKRKKVQPKPAPGGAINDSGNGTPDVPCVGPDCP